ncbi:enoyl-CoA hydratase [Stutzerimonas stutzeri]|jgi:enoyl-CoA hydratase/carnithine racemase|nr:enoyl-CoA hydratase [Stutzerimonas stutzeri]
MDVMIEQPVLYQEMDDGIAVITLNRPEKRNALNVSASRMLADYVSRTEANNDIRVVILAAEGTAAFCAGADLDDIAAGHGERIALRETGLGGLIHAQRQKPWIAAVKGAALGGGTELALACDMIVAGPAASFSLPEVRHGMIAGAAGIYRLTRRIAPALAMELLLTGNRLSAQRALALGLINHLVEDEAEDVLQHAQALAQRIAANAPLAVRETLRIARQAFDLSEQQLRTRTDAASRRLAQSEDMLIGIKAFQDRCEPRWTGR